jgi:hypothetical protein
MTRNKNHHHEQGFRPTRKRKEREELVFTVKSFFTVMLAQPNKWLGEGLHFTKGAIGDINHSRSLVLEDDIVAIVILLLLVVSITAEMGSIFASSLQLLNCQSK